jgi:hypothetical protein
MIDITGLRVVRDVKGCCGVHAIVVPAAADAQHDYELCCTHCNSRREPLPERAAEFLRSTVRTFGIPSSPVFRPAPSGA